MNEIYCPLTVTYMVHSAFVVGWTVGGDMAASLDVVEMGRSKKKCCRGHTSISIHRLMASQYNTGLSPPRRAVVTPIPREGG